MDEVFKALADPVRRAILDRLFERGGQTLSELCEGHDMSRFGVMKHLRVLEAAHLVVTRKAGREKLHYLNAVPIQQIHDRWVAKYAASISSALLGLKHELEEASTSAAVEAAAGSDAGASSKDFIKPKRPRRRHS